MKKLIPFTFFCSILFFSCRNKDVKSEKDQHSYAEKYKLEVTDTFRLNYTARLVKVLDYNVTSKNILFSSYSMDTIVQTDLAGRISNKFVFKGGGPKEAGVIIHNVGYFNDTSIIVNSERGFYFYNLKGELVRSLEERTPLKAIGSALDTRIREFSKGDSSCILLHLKSVADVDISDFFSLSNLEKFKSTTLYNLTNQTYRVLFGYEPNSIFRTDYKYNYGEPENIFDYDYTQNDFYIVHNPEPVLYKYSLANNFSTFTAIDLSPDHFNLPVKYKSNDFTSDHKYAAVNSQFRDINCFEDYIFLDYKTGIPEKEYDDMKTESELPELYKKHMKNYAILLKNDKKICGDILLPLYSTGISFVKSLDYIFVRTNASATETADATIFYICKLIRDEE